MSKLELQRCVGMNIQACKFGKSWIQLWDTFPLNILFSSTCQDSDNVIV